MLIKLYEVEGTHAVAGEAPASAHNALCAALSTLRAKTDLSAPQSDKKNYSQQMSECLAVTIAEQLRQRGLAGIRPSGPGVASLSGAERRLSGGLAAKKVDVSWSTEESGLILGVSIKCINFQDQKTGNFQKNLTNRRNDMLIEAVSLHRRFPFSILVGMLFLDVGSRSDGTIRRKSTFDNAFPKTRLFTGRNDPAGRDEQYECLYLASIEATPWGSKVDFFEADDAENQLTLDTILDNLVKLVAERNFDFYEVDAENQIVKI